MHRRGGRTHHHSLASGVSLNALAAGADPDRTVLSEYHAMGSRTGAFMVRLEEYKYVHYVAYPPQLFDLASDPEELTDLAGDPAYDSVLREARGRLHSLCNPQAVDAAAKETPGGAGCRQRRTRAVIARGDLGFSVPPGVEPMFD